MPAATAVWNIAQPYSPQPVGPFFETTAKPTERVSFFHGTTFLTRGSQVSLLTAAYYSKTRNLFAKSARPGEQSLLPSLRGCTEGYNGQRKDKSRWSTVSSWQTLDIRPERHENEQFIPFFICQRHYHRLSAWETTRGGSTVESRTGGLHHS